MHWAQAILFCGGLIFAAVDDLKTRTVSNIVCIVIALAGLISISPASLLGALLAMLPFYLCAGFGLMGGGDWRLAAAVGFVLGVGRVLTGFFFMAAALLLASLVTARVRMVSRRSFRNRRKSSDGSMSAISLGPACG